MSLEEEAFAIALSTEQVSVYCNYCIRKASPLRKCTGCKWVVYCGSDCQKRDWLQHKAECKAIQQRDGITDDGIRLVMRLACCWAKKDYGQVEVDDETRSLQTLEDHGSKKGINDLAETFLKQYKQFSVKEFVSEDIVMKLFKIVAINSFSVSNEFGSAIGIGLCIKLSKALHSCNPNTRVVFSGRHARLHSTSSSAPASLSEATHSYIDELQPRAIRRKLLKEKYQFDCECVGCRDEERNRRMEAWCCLECNHWIEASEEAVCSSCNSPITQDHIEVCKLAEATATGGNEHVAREELPLQQRVQIAEKILSVAEDALHKHNVLRLTSLRVLYASALGVKDIEKAYYYGMQLLEIHSQYQQPTDVAIVYLKYGLSQVFIAREKQREALQMLQDIRPKFEELHGRNSEVCTNINAAIKSISK